MSKQKLFNKNSNQFWTQSYYVIGVCLTTGLTPSFADDIKPGADTCIGTDYAAAKCLNLKIEKVPVTTRTDEEVLLQDMVSEAGSPKKWTKVVNDMLSGSVQADIENISGKPSASKGSDFASAKILAAQIKTIDAKSRTILMQLFLDAVTESGPSGDRWSSTLRDIFMATIQAEVENN